MFLTLIYFLIFSTNFQTHYLSWIIPFFIIFILAYSYFSILDNIFIALNVIGFNYAFRNEFGPKTFFLDILEHFNPSALSSKLDVIFYREGALIILLLVVTLIVLALIKNNTTSSKANKIYISFYFLFMLTLWLILIIPYIQSIGLYNSQQEHNNELAFRRGIIHRGILFAEYGPLKNESNKLIFENIDNSNSLIVFELPKLSSEEKRNFDAYLLIKENVDNSVINNYSANLRFNGCDMGKFYDKIFNQYDQKYFKGFMINVSCIKPQGNYILLNEINSKNFSLYIENKKVEYPYIDSKKNFINILSIIGIIYILLIGCYSMILIKKLNKRNGR